MNSIKKALKNERGMTLIELLAVVVILGIIAAIAIPSIGGLIDNTKKDAHVANAQQMVSSAKIWVTGNAEEFDATNTARLTLQEMENQDLIDPIKDPDGDEDSYVKTGEGTAGSYVLITKTDTRYTYEVKLVNAERGIWADERDLKRRNVTDVVPTVKTQPTKKAD